MYYKLNPTIASLALMVGVAFAQDSIDRAMPFTIENPTDTIKKTIDEIIIEGYFQTRDAVNLHYRFMVRPQATSTIIVSCGCWPGDKDGYLSLAGALPTNCNILFYDGRGRGKSDYNSFYLPRAELGSGLIQTATFSYGIKERLDVIAAVEFANKQMQGLPCILLGFCGGAYNSLHAAIALKHENKLKALNIIGIVVDSGFGRIKDAFDSNVKNWADDHLPSFFAPILCCVIHTFLAPLINDKETNLLGIINQLQLPIMFIHSKDDNAVPINVAYELANQIDKDRKHCWWITEPSKHIEHYNRYPSLYKEKITEFILFATNYSAP